MVLVNGWCSSGKLREAQQFLEEMINKGFNPSVRRRDLMIEGLLNAGYLESAKKMVIKITKEGFVPDVNTFNSLMEAVCKVGEVGRIDEAFRLLHNAIEDGHRPFPSLYGPRIKGCMRGQFDDAFCFFGEMKVKGHPPNRPVYTMLITMCGRGGRYAEAANYLV
ncbi:hypothetical protein GH714_000810 [Hevea brasiliensis]|uniref:Pentacotripeptide-repeat region of PRORP domain-containing protein n=1 Tax=Hevea brasiliensis TaxID=3981 RepID=A0A6A6KH30_HEVBR|nr:hypothetical protein GH714_000810 [Hevea brasiliensis]